MKYERKRKKGLNALLKFRQKKEKTNNKPRPKERRSKQMGLGKLIGLGSGSGGAKQPVTSSLPQNPQSDDGPITVTPSGMSRRKTGVTKVVATTVPHERNVNSEVVAQFDKDLRRQSGVQDFFIFLDTVDSLEKSMDGATDSQIYAGAMGVMKSQHQISLSDVLTAVEVAQKAINRVANAQKQTLEDGEGTELQDEKDKLAELNEEMSALEKELATKREKARKLETSITASQAVMDGKQIDINKVKEALAADIAAELVKIQEFCKKKK
jgi:hypothetical protein